MQWGTNNLLDIIDDVYCVYSDYNKNYNANKSRQVVYVLCRWRVGSQNYILWWAQGTLSLTLLRLLVWYVHKYEVGRWPLVYMDNRHPLRLLVTKLSQPLGVSIHHINVQYPTPLYKYKRFNKISAITIHFSCMYYISINCCWKVARHGQKLKKIPHTSWDVWYFRLIRHAI